MTRILLCCALALFGTSNAVAQLTPTPEPVVSASIDPARVVVGQKATLLLTVLAPNYMPAPPVLPDFQVRNAVTRPLGAVNQMETRDGTTYAGVRYEFAIYPQEEGSFAIANQKVTVTYAAEPPQSRSATLDVPRLALDAFIPELAENLDPFVSSNALSFEQSVKRSSQELKVGDSITRTVTTKADGTPAMLLPPVTFDRIEGLALYPAQPSVQDNVDRRTGALSATRIDEATYILERPGDYDLPPKELAWWNARESKIERTRINAITIHVADNPALRATASTESPTTRRGRDYIDAIRDHWLLTIIAVGMLATIGRFAPAAIQSIGQHIARRRTAYRASEAFSFAQLRAASHDGDPVKVYFALLDWLRRFEPLSPSHNLDTLKKAARDPGLDRELASLEARLFSPEAEQGAQWTARNLLKSVKVVRRRLRNSGAARAHRKALPDHLNPVVAQPQIDPRWRPVAR
jgi:BatD DUF11 like domain